MPVVLSTSSRAACRVLGRLLMSLDVVLDEGHNGRQRKDVLLNMLILGCQLIRPTGLDCFPGLRNSLPPNLRVFHNPCLEVTCLIFSEQRTLPSHNRVMEEHPSIAVLLLDHERGYLVDDLLLFTAVP